MSNILNTEFSMKTFVWSSKRLTRDYFLNLESVSFPFAAVDFRIRLICQDQSFVTVHSKLRDFFNLRFRVRFQVDVKNCRLFFGEKMSDFFESDVLRFRKQNEHDRDREEEHNREEVEGAGKSQLMLEQGKRFEADDQQDAGERPGGAFAESSHFRREEFA